MRRSNQLETFDMGFVGGRDVAKADGEQQGPRLRVVEVKGSDFFEADERLQEKIETGPDFGLGGSPASLVSLAWKLKRMSG